MRASARGVLLFKGDHVAGAHDAFVMASAFAYTDTAHGSVPEMTFIFRELEMRLGLPRMKVCSQPQIFINGKGIDDLAGIHFVLRIPDRFEFSEGLYHFGTKHLGQHLCLRLAVTMLSGDGSPVADNQIGGLVDERAKVANSFDGTEVEVDTRVNAALPEVSIERAIVTMLLEQSAQVAQVGTDLLGRNGGVLPTFPRNRLSWHKGRRAKSGLATLTNQFLFALVVIELHGWGARFALQPRHHSSRFGIGFSLVLATKLH